MVTIDYNTIVTMAIVLESIMLNRNFTMVKKIKFHKPELFTFVWNIDYIVKICCSNLVFKFTINKQYLH